MRPIQLLVAVACISGVAALQAQSGPTPVPSPQTFRTATRLVQVSVVVHDGRNRPIDGLRGEDFEVFEDGKALPIAFFSVRSQDPARSAAAGDRAGATPDVAGTFTNRIPSPSNGGVVAIIFDQLNTSPSDQAHAREHLLKYLGTVRPDDRVALYVLTSNGLKVLYDFTRDAESLLKALRTVQPGGSRELAASEERLNEAVTADLSAFARGTLVNAKAFYMGLRAETSVEALEEVASRLAGVSGRKNLIWISSGFPFVLPTMSPAGRSAAYMTPETRRAARALSNSDVAVYPVDARGLIATPSETPQRLASLKTIGEPIEGLRVTAEWTGGRMFFNTNDIGAAISRAADDSRLTYVLGYYPVAENWDGKFRSIKVKVRRPGVEVRHRSGYFAIPLLPTDADTRQKALAEAVESPLEATALPLNVRGRYEGTRINLAIELDPGSVTFTKGNGAWTGALDVAIAQTLPGERHLRDADVSMPFVLSDQSRERLLTEGLRLTRTIDLRSETQQVRVVVRDAGTGSVGSVFIDAERLRKAAAAGHRETLPLFGQR